MATLAGRNGTGVIDGTQSVLTFTTTRDIQAGEHVCVLTGNNGGSVATQSITVGALSLSLDKMGPNTFSHIELWSKRATALIASGSTVTVTLPSTVSICIHAICASFGGIISSNYVGPTATGTGAGFLVGTGITATTGYTRGVCVAGVRTDSHDETTFTPNNGYASAGEIHDATADMAMSMTFLLNPLIGVQEETWTLSVASGNDGLIVFYQPGPEPSDTPVFVGGHGAC